MKKLYTINTVNNFMDMIYKPFGIPFEEKHDDLEITNIMDDGLLKATREYGKVTPAVASKVYNYTRSAQLDGADAILVTCTSVNEVTKMCREFLNIPILNIEEPTAEELVRAGEKIAIVGTIPTSPVAFERQVINKAHELNKDVKISKVVVSGAFEEYNAGNIEKHDAMINDALKKLADKVDAIAFSQISMSKAKYDNPGVPVFKIGEAGFQKIYNLMK